LGVCLRLGVGAAGRLGVGSGASGCIVAVICHRWCGDDARGALCRMGVWPMRLATSEVRTDGGGALGSGRLGRGHDGAPATG
jgi:hypothetical protein